MYVTWCTQQEVLAGLTALPFLPKIFQIMKAAAEPEALTLGPWGRDLRQSHIIQPSGA